MKDETVQAEPEVKSGPGTRLAAAREAAGKTATEIAERLNLRPAVIEAIDADDYQSLPSATFVRGYLRAYARDVGLPESEIMTAFEEYGDAKSASSNMQSFSRRTSNERSDSRVMWLTYLIVLVLIGFVVLWWWQKNQDQALRLQTMPQATEVSEALNQPSQPKNSTLAQPEPEIEPVSQTALEQMPAAELEPVTDESEAESSQAEQFAPPAQAEAEIIEANESEVGELSAPAENQTAQANSQPNDTQQGNVIIRLAFAKDCWIKVEDANGRVVAEGVKTPARDIEFAGVPPFNAIFGAPDAVTVEYQGKPYSFVVEDAGRPLRLTIPETE